MEKNIDRRIQRTQKKLRIGIATLLETNLPADISVRQLCDASGVNRGTFYLHYVSIADMMEQFRADLVQELQAVAEKYSAFSIYTSPCAVITELAQFIRDNEDIAKLLFCPSEGYMMLTHTLAELEKYFVERNTQSNKGRAPTDPIYFTFVLNGIFGVLLRWYQSGMHQKPSVIAQNITNIWVSGRKVFRS